MTDKTREIKVELELARKGDGEVIREATEDLNALAPAADDATRTLEKLEDLDFNALNLRQVADAAADVQRSAGPAAAGLAKVDAALKQGKADEATRRIAEAVEILTGKTIQAADSAGRAADAYAAFGGSPTDFIGRTNSALERAVVLTADLQKQVDEMATEAGEGMSGFADRTAKARQRIAEVEKIVAELGADEVPELTSELRRLKSQFETTFETGSRKAAELEAEIENTEDRLRRMKLATREGAEGVTDLGEAFQLQFPRAGKAVAGAASAVHAFREAFSATRETISFFREQFGIDIDQIVADALRLQAVSDLVIGAANDVAEQGELLRNQRRIFENLGLEGLSSDVEKNAQLIEEHFRTIRQSAETTSEFLSRLQLNPDQLTEQAEKFATDFNTSMNQAGDKLDLSALKDRVRGEVQSLLDNLIASGTDVPQAFQQIADSLGILPSSVQKVADETKERTATLKNDLRSLLLEIPGFIDESAASLREKEAVLKTALEKVFDGVQGVNLLKPEQKDALKAQIEEVVRLAGQLGEKIDPVIAAHAGNLGVLIDRYTQTATSVEDAMARIQDAANETADEMDAASLAQQESISVVVNALDEYGKEAVIQKTVTKEMALAMKLSELDEADPKIRAYVLAVKDAQKQLEATGGTAGQAATEMKKPADQAGEAGSKVGELAGASRDLADTSKDAGSSLNAQADAISRIAESARTENISGLRGELELLSETRFADPIVNQFDEIIGKADEAFQAIQKLNRAGQDGGAPTPEPSAPTPAEVTV